MWVPASGEWTVFVMKCQAHVTGLLWKPCRADCFRCENSVECHASVFHWSLCVLCMHGTKFEVPCSFLYALFPRLTSSSRSIHSSIHLINGFQGPVPIIRPYPKRLSGCRSIPTRERLVLCVGLHSHWHCTTPCYISSVNGAMCVNPFHGCAAARRIFAAFSPLRP